MAEIPMPITNKQNQSPASQKFYDELGAFYRSGPWTDVEKLQNFLKYVPIVDTGRFLARSKIFELILGVHGCVIECGVFNGGGLMAWAQLSAILEPLNHVRQIVGFDTFSGFPNVTKEDRATPEAVAQPGDLSSDSYDNLKEGIRLYDLYRPLGHIPRVHLVRGDAVESIPSFIEATPHLVVALLYLDFDLYEPTKAAIERFLPYMPKGAVIAFDELNNSFWPGETQAVRDSIGLRNLRLQRFPWQPQMSYAVLE